MELISGDDLSREEILNILEQRRLYINDMHELTHAELLRVYKTFALPLSRRPQRHNKHQLPLNHQQIFGESCTDIEEDEEGRVVMLNAANAEKLPMDVDQLLGIGEEECTTIMRSTTNTKLIGEKRRPTDENLVDDYQYHLSTATKRIRINTFL